MVDIAVKSFGKIDVLVNNAAISLDSMFYDKTAESFNKTLSTNVVGTFLVSKLVGEIMYNNKFGKIINISSTNGINTYYPMCLEYDASKAAIISLTHNLAIQFAPYVNVNAVAPGLIDTPLTASTGEDSKATTDYSIIHRMGTAEEIANAINFLLSDEASYITGQILAVDGGFTLK